MKKLTYTLIDFAPFLIAITGVSTLIYVSVQQMYRQELNDPQIQIVRDAEVALLSGKSPAEVVGRAELFDVQKSLKPFVAIYDTSKKVLESNASVGNQPPQPPIGVFAYAKTHGENRVTWQPNASTRIALVVRPVATNTGWYVASGRNMEDAENRLVHLRNSLILGTCSLLLITLLLTYYMTSARRKT